MNLTVTLSVCSLSPCVSNWHYLILVILGSRGQQLLRQSLGLDTSFITIFILWDQSIYLDTHRVPRQPPHQASTLTLTHTHRHFCYAIPLRLLKEKNKIRFP